MLQPHQYRENRERDARQTLLIIAGLSGLLTIVTWMLAGPVGFVGILGIGFFTFLFSNRARPDALLRLYGASELDPYYHPRLYYLLRSLARRAELPTRPRLFYLPYHTPNAFAMGSPEHPFIAVSQGILSRFDEREVAGILGHEISHLKNRDTTVVSLSLLFGRLTSLMSQIGLVMLLFSLPAFFLGYKPFPWLLITVLYFAPSISALLQLALSSTREFAADMDAARLTNDPRGLASALYKLERATSPWWENLFFPYRRVAQPHLLRTHPPTEERIQRLLQVEETTRSLPHSNLPRHEPLHHWPDPLRLHPFFPIYSDDRQNKWLFLEPVER